MKDLVPGGPAAVPQLVQLDGAARFDSAREAAQRPREGTLRPPGQTAAVATVDPIVSVACSPGCSSEAYSSTSSFRRWSSEGSWPCETCSSGNCSSRAPCSSLAVRMNSLIRR